MISVSFILWPFNNQLTQFLLILITTYQPILTESILAIYYHLPSYRSERKLIIEQSRMYQRYQAHLKGLCLILLSVSLLLVRAAP